ncbi:MAG: tyrosine protein kinase [Pedobacter sp.]|nr:MAG: tyrosine protein kinase [Pedobacter sp.]
MKQIIKYRRYWPVFLICMLLSISVAAAYIYLATPYYFVSTTLMVQDDKKGDGMLKESAFSDLNMFHSTKTIDNEIQILRSTNTIQKVLKSLAIATRCFIDGPLIKKEVYGSSSPLKINVINVNNLAYTNPLKVSIVNANEFRLSTLGFEPSKTYRFGERIKGPGFVISVDKTRLKATAGEKFEVSFINTYELAKSYHNTRLDITPVVKDANVLQISLQDNIPERGMAILNQLVKEYNMQDVLHKNQMALATIDFIDTRLSYLTTDLGSVELNVQKYKQQNRVTNIQSDAESNLSRAEEYKQDLEKVKVQLNILNTIDKSLRKSASFLPIVPGTGSLQDGTLLSLIAKYNTTLEEYQQLLSGNLPGNPLVVAVKDRLVIMRDNISNNILSIRNNLNITQNNLASNYTEFDARIKATPALETGLQQRDREQVVKANLFQYLMQKREETALALSSNIADAKVVDPAGYESIAAKPKKQFIYLCAFIMGFIIPISLISAKEFFDNRIYTIQEVKENGNLKILGELCHSQQVGILASTDKRRSDISELFRYLRTNLTLNMDGKHRQVLMVTSSIQGEGKTFTSINLAASLSDINKKVLLLEFDLRKPDLLRQLGIDAGKGVSDYIYDLSTTLSDIVYPSGISDNLFVIGSGTMLLNSGNDLQNPRIADLFRQLREEFDYIILDTSPVALVADAFNLATYIDTTIYVIRYNYTSRAYLNVLADIEKNNKLKELMIILNDGKTDNINDYGYGSRCYS